MLKQLVIVGLLFAVGVSFGAVFTPVGMDMMESETKGPVHQKKHSNKEIKSFVS